MSESIKSYRIRTNVGEDKFLSINLEQDYDAFDILSLTINTNDTYRLHNSNYGVVVGRVLANNGFGIPNAKISIFIEADNEQRAELSAIYSYRSTADANSDGVRYNLLPDDYNGGDCHQVVGTFPNKRYVLDNDDVIEVFDKYFKYTTRTNNAGDYIIMGVPVGTQTLHMDLDLSDCGILSQRPRDFVYKGYTIEQFENPNMFKTGTSLSSLSQIFSQDQNVYVQPFWGNDSLGETIGITRADINVEFKFEPTCVFMGSVVSDNASNGISKNCKPTEHMGDMDELTTGEGTIEMIRKTFAGNVEEFRIKGNELINGAGIWCYQIPMNLDYMVTDEFGNMVPTDNPDKGIPTRARVRFRISMNDSEKNTDNFFRPKVLVPHNPQVIDSVSRENYDYNFGTATEEASFRDLFWNNVYSVKSYIPRFQKKKTNAWKTAEFTGIKGCQAYGKNNPMPYNNIRIKLPFMFQVMCILIKIFIKMVGLINWAIDGIGVSMADAAKDVKIPTGFYFKNGGIHWRHWYPLEKWLDIAKTFKLTVIANGLCPDLDNWYFAPIYGRKSSAGAKKPNHGGTGYDLMKQTLNAITTVDDPMSIDDQNDAEESGVCLTTNTNYLISCVEMNLAQEYRVINFDFYNDWVNGTLYIPRFMRYVRKKKKFLGITVARAKTKGCMDNASIFSKTRRYTQTCAIPYVQTQSGAYKLISNVNFSPATNGSNKFHKNKGTQQETIFGNRRGGIVHEAETMKGEYVYYIKPCEWKTNTKKVNLFATDIVLLGSLNSCDINGVPQAFKHLTSSTYIMPTNLALTNMEENGYVYAYGNSETICSKNNDSSKDNKYTEELVPLSGGSLTAELKYYNGSEVESETTYGGTEDTSDTIPITEAAGISWNYIGPGQGENKPSEYYYPGGHFLGLSCVNSQTNIKSCINLERICEIGVNMSQRKEEVRAVDGDILKYEYIIPTGLISGNDIIDEDFRSMFASLNAKRLIADKINAETGYKVYDFTYLGPINFNGEMGNYTGGTNNPYNKKLVIEDESSALNKYKIAGAETRSDYDEEETAHTFTKTIEFPSVDYYAFRFGLSHKDLEGGVKDRHAGKFLKNINNAYYLPQYENSFYFYFGLQNGNTALDEFNKQFFSECPSKTLVDMTPEIRVFDTNGFIPCRGGSEVLISIDKMTPPYEIKVVKSSGESESFISNNDIFTFFAPYGETEVTVKDSDENEVSTEFFDSENSVTWNINTCDFFEDVPTTGMSTGRTSYNETGGYVEISDITINGLIIGSDNVKIEFENNRTHQEYLVDYESGATSVFAAPSPDEYDYNIIYSATCGGSVKEVIIKCGTIAINEPEDLYLTMGIGEVKDASNNGAKIKMDENHFNKNWWQNSLLDEDEDGRTTKWWGVRKGLINGASTTAETFSNLVAPANGNKATWMTPQNNVGYANDKSLQSSLYPDGIPDGYSVDDDASYQGTYRVSNVKPNYAVCYDEEGRVMGIHCATVNEGEYGQIKKITIVNGITPLPVWGDACVFKPLPDGPLIPCVFSGITTTPPMIVSTIKCLWDETDIQQYQKGMVYQCVSYPIIKKPFTANCEYFFHEAQMAPLDYILTSEEEIQTYFQQEWGKQLFWYREEDGRIGSITDGLSKVDAWVEVKNGVTFDKHFAGESYISYIKPQNGYSNNFSVDTLDLAVEITGGPITNRTALFSGTTYCPSDNDASFMIKEGYPHYYHGRSDQKYYAYDRNLSLSWSEIGEWSLYSNYANEIELNEDAVFYDKFDFIDMSTDSENKIRIIGNGDSDSDIQYYLFSGSQTTKKVLVCDKRQIHIIIGTAVVAMTCSAITYPVIISGETAFFTAYVSTTYRDDKRTALLPGYSNTDKRFCLIQSAVSQSVTDDTLINYIYSVSGSTNATDKEVNASGLVINFISGTVLSSLSNEDALSKCINGEVPKLTFVNNFCEINGTSEDLKLVVLGVKEIPDNGKAKGYLCKFYHYIKKV